MLLTLFLIGLFSGMVTGLLSVGGGILLIFFLMIIPPIALNMHFTMQKIASFSIMQAFFSTLSGGYYYIKNQLVNTKVTLVTGLPAMMGGMIGVFLANQFSDFVLRALFAAVAVVSALLMIIPAKAKEEQEPFTFTFKTWTISITTGFLIGILGGLIGLSAGFIFVPMMLIYYKLPIKMAIGSSLFTCFLLSIGSLITKFGMGHIPYAEVGVLIVGGMIGAQLGGRITKRLSSTTLKRIAAYSILLISVKMLYDLLF